MDAVLILFVVIIVALLIAGIIIVPQISLAKYRAVRDHKKEVVLFGGFVKLILWELNEGLVLLRNKSISDVIYDSPGGTKFIFPIRGEELRARVPLTTRMVLWEDTNILTRESIQVRMKVALWWKVANLKTYIFEIDRSIHVESLHAEGSLLESAEIWLKTVAESALRTLVSQLSVAFLVSSKATSYLHVEQTHDKAVPPQSSPEILAPDLMVNELQQIIARKVADYGIAIQRIEIQEISLAAEIQQAIDKVWKASLLPAQTEQEARARQIELQAIANVLGVEATAINEIMRNFQGSNFYTMPQFMDQLFARMSFPSPNSLSPSSDSRQIGSVDGEST